MRFRPTLPTPAMVVALIALSVALGGTGYAAGQLTRTPAATAAKSKKKTKPFGVQQATTLFQKLFAAADDGGKDLTALNAFLATTSVPNAKHASSADSATTAVNATNAANATNAVNASNAANATNAVNASNAVNATTAATATSPSTLGSGQTETGAWAVGSRNSNSGGNSFAETAISFPFPLASAPNGNVIPLGGPSTAACPGTASSPSATPGNLCVYEGTNGYTAVPPALCHLAVSSCVGPGAPADKNGAAIEVVSTTTPGNFYSAGTWAVEG